MNENGNYYTLESWESAVDMWTMANNFTRAWCAY